MAKLLHLRPNQPSQKKTTTLASFKYKVTSLVLALIVAIETTVIIMLLLT